jgi:hypothetical protein
MYLTRNQAYRKVPWVRIPPSPPMSSFNISNACLQVVDLIELFLSKLLPVLKKVTL